VHGISRSLPTQRLWLPTPELGSEAFRALGCYFERGFEREAGFDEFAFFEEAADERDAMGDAAGWGEFWQGVLGVGGPVAAGFCDFYEAGAEG